MSSRSFKEGAVDMKLDHKAFESLTEIKLDLIFPTVFFSHCV